MFSLAGKTALITGATGGIGGGIARLFKAQGASLLLTGRRVGVLRALAEELGGESFPCDLADEHSRDDLLAWVRDRAAVDILVNNAGMARDGLAMSMKEGWDEVLLTNLTSVFRLTQGVLRGMVKRRWGRIVMIGSVLGTTGNKGQSNYVAAKSGLLGLTKSLAQEVATRNITVNCIAPGFIETRMTEGLSESVRTHALSQIPLGRYGTPDDVACAALFLASEESCYTTGQTLHVNGGLLMP